VPGLAFLVGLFVATSPGAAAIVAAPASPVAVVESYLTDVPRPPYSVTRASALVTESTLPTGFSRAGSPPVLAWGLPQGTTAAERTCVRAASGVLGILGAHLYGLRSRGASLAVLGGGQVGSGTAVRVSLAQPNLHDATLSAAQRSAHQRAMGAALHASGLTETKYLAAIPGAAQLCHRFQTDCMVTGTSKPSALPVAKMGFEFSLPAAASLTLGMEMELEWVPVSTLPVVRRTITFRLVDTPAGWRIDLSGDALVPGLNLFDWQTFKEWTLIHNPSAGSTSRSGAVGGGPAPPPPARPRRPEQRLPSRAGRWPGPRREN
jgi:hypothetical protein